MRPKGALPGRNFLLGAVGCGTLLCLLGSEMRGQQVPKPTTVTAADTQTAGAVPLQMSPVALPEKAVLPVVLNLRAWLGYPTAIINVNGRGGERFGISTGLNANTITPASVIRLRIPEGKSKVRVNILEHEENVAETSLQSLQVGLLKLENVPFAELDTVSLVSHAPHPDAPIGWLGVPFLSAFQITLDISRRICVLDSPKAKLPGGAIVVPLTLRNGHLFVSMSVPKSKPFQAMLDTGSVLSLIPAAAGEKLKLKPQEVVKLGADKKVEANLIQAPQVNVGKAECKSLLVAYLSADASPTMGRDTAVLGLDFLSRFKVVINATAKKVAFLPLTAPDAAPPPKPDVKKSTPTRPNSNPNPFPNRFPQTG